METLKAIWETYKGDVIPVIVTGLLLIVSALFVYIANKIKAQGKVVEPKESVDIEAIKEGIISDVDDKFKDFKNMLYALKDGIYDLSVLFNTAFQESSLPVETKEALVNLCNRIKNGVSEDAIKSLELEIKKYKELYQDAVEKLADTASEVKEITEDTIKRVRK